MKAMHRAGRSGLVIAVAAIVLAIGLGWLAPAHPVIVLAAAGMILALGIASVDVSLIAVVALPLLYVVARAAAGGVDLSVSDLALGAATVPALIFATRPFSPPMRTLLWLTVVYQVATLFTVVANPYPANVIEWVHAWVLIAGALLVGWVVGREGHADLGLKLMLGAALILATWVIGTGALAALAGDFRPVYLPFRMHKNFLGTVIGITALIVYIRPAWLSIKPRIAMMIFWWLVIGLGFTQSRQAIVALGVALVVLVLRTRTDRRRSRAILLAIIPALAVVLTLVRDQFASDNQHNSVYQRLTWFGDSLDIWSQQPIVGVGLRWWYTDRFAGAFQPPNAEIEVLTSAGLIGLAGFLVFMIGSVAVLWRVPPAYGMLALLAVLSRFVQGQMDLFWVAAQCSVPFAIAGICLGVWARHEDEGKSLAHLRAVDDSMAPLRSAPRIARSR